MQRFRHRHLTAALAASLLAASPASAETLYIQAGRLIDGVANEVRTGQCITVEAELYGFYARVGAMSSVETLAGSIDIHGWVGYGDKNMNNALYANNKAGLADFGIEATWSKQLSDNTTGYVKVGYTTLFDSNHLQGQPNRNNFIFGFGVGIGL